MCLGFPKYKRDEFYKGSRIDAATVLTLILITCLVIVEALIWMKENPEVVVQVLAPIISR